MKNKIVYLVVFGYTISDWDTGEKRNGAAIEYFIFLNNKNADNKYKEIREKIKNDDDYFVNIEEITISDWNDIESFDIAV